MIETWTQWVCEPSVLWAWVAIAAGAFVFLLYVPAPYGRHDAKGWGPTLPARIGWIGMESVTLVGFGLCFWVGAADGATDTDHVSVVEVVLQQEREYAPLPQLRRRTGRKR